MTRGARQVQGRAAEAGPGEDTPAEGGMVHGEVTISPGNELSLPAETNALLSLIDASPDALTCSDAEAAEWAERLRVAIERARGG